MASYYYLMSSLPMLRADGAMPFTYADFLDMCRNNVSAEAYSRLEGLTVNSDEGPLIDDWADFYGALSGELNYQRCLRQGRPCEMPADRDEDSVRTVAAAIGAKNPLEAETLLLAFEFERLDELVGLHSFDEYVLNGYALKLKLLERATVFDKAGGRTEFKRLLDNVQQQIISI